MIIKMFQTQLFRLMNDGMVLHPVKEKINLGLCTCRADGMEDVDAVVVGHTNLCGITYAKIEKTAATV